MLKVVTKVLKAYYRNGNLLKLTRALQSSLGDEEIREDYTLKIAPFPDDDFNNSRKRSSQF